MGEGIKEGGKEDIQESHTKEDQHKQGIQIMVVEEEEEGGDGNGDVGEVKAEESDLVPDLLKQMTVPQLPSQTSASTRTSAAEQPQPAHQPQQQQRKRKRFRPKKMKRKLSKAFANTVDSYIFRLL